MFAHLIEVVGFEVAVVALVEANQDRHDFAQAERPLALTRFQVVTQQLAVPDGFKHLAKVIDMAEQFF